MNKNRALSFKNQKITIKRSKIHGLGIVTNENIKKGEVIFLIKGEKKFREIKNTKTSLYGKNWIGIGKNLWIDPNVGHGRYLNHSCNPSASITGKVKVVALRDLGQGEEITIDYSLVEGDHRWYMHCECGSKNCRKVIKSINFLPEEVFRKYMPFVPTYFKKIYIKHNGR